MIKLYNKDTEEYLGEILENDLQFLVDNLEEEYLKDTDYYINKPMLDILKEKGISRELFTLIEKAMGQNSEVEIKYEKV